MKRNGELESKSGRTWIAAVLLAISLGFTLPTDNDFFFKINKSIDIFGRIYREIATTYVDEVDPEKFMEAGIEGMLGTLDPYTVYIEEKNGVEVELLTTGKYGGIGVTIGQRDGAIQVITVMEGYSAQRQGVLPGDKILEVDGVKILNRQPDDIRSLTRGAPGTEVRVTIEREGESAPMQFVLIREEIQLKNVTYSAYVDSGLGYIRLERFSPAAGEEVRTAIRDLKLKGDLKGLVLDLRGNPGGLLDAAVDVVSKFVPRNTLVVNTKGRRAEADKSYYSREEPMFPDQPVVVLTDRNSASASEIVSGALQDLDRVLVVGTRTFGKGLVQTVVDLPYETKLKITTARYYIPSGRSIQEIDYKQRDGHGVFAAYADSLKKEFKTAGGRIVFEHGGVMPDSAVTDVDLGPMVLQLYRKSLFFRFCNTYVAEHKGVPLTGVTDAILEDFRAYLAEQKFDYEEESETKLEELGKLAVKLNYSERVQTEIKELNEALAKEKERGFDRYKDRIRSELEVELMARVRGEQGRIEASLKDDPQLAVGLEFLKNRKMYSKKIKA
ncbi:MAG: S41 family peptidase [Bacteroidota bacterium]